MHRNSLGVLGLVFILVAGCAPKQPLVYVDLNQVFAVERLPKAIETVRPQQPPGIPASTLTFPALPATAFRLGSDKARIAQVQQVLEQSRREALTMIAASLRESYEAGIRTARDERLASEAPGGEARFAEANQEGQKLFETYAAKRAPLMMTLAVKASFPDVDPRSQNPPPSEAVFATIKFRQAKALREKIAKLDADFRSQRTAVYAAMEEQYRAKIDAINKDFDSQIAAADAKAEAEANAEVSKAQEKLKAVLEDKSVIAFPPEPGRTVTVAGTQAPTAPPTVTEPGRAEVEQRMREAEVSDLKVWAALRGYVISSDRRNARNVTSEFIQWKNSLPALP
jgi:hypothetical protein